MASSTAFARRVRDGTAKSPCCGAGLLWEQIHGMRVCHEIVRRRKKLYRAECSQCHKRHDLDGGHA